MEHSKQVMAEAGVLPRLRLMIKKGGGGTVSTGPHRVKILKDKPATVVKDGKDVEGIRYLFEENGEHKIYERAVKNKNGELDYFIERMAEMSEGDEMILESRKIGAKNYIEIIPILKSRKVETDEEDEEEKPE